MGHGRAKDRTFTKSSTSQGVATTTAATVSVPYWEDPETNTGQAQKKVEDPPPGPAGHDEMCHLVTSTFLSESLAPTHTDSHTDRRETAEDLFFPFAHASAVLRGSGAGGPRIGRK